MATTIEQPSALIHFEADDLQREAVPAHLETDSIARLRSIFRSIDEEVVSAVVTHNRGALVPSIMQLIELADEDETASCMDDLEAALQEAARLDDEAPTHATPDLDEQVALAAQSDIDEQVALALQQKMDADAAAAAAAAAAANTHRAATRPSSAGWRRNVAKLAGKLSPSELRLLVDRVKKSGQYRSRTGAVALLDPDHEGSATVDQNESDERDERDYEPPVPPPPVPPTPAGDAAPSGRSTLYESRVQRARTSNAGLVGNGGPARPNDGFIDLAL